MGIIPHHLCFSDKELSNPEFVKDLIDWLYEAGYAFLENCEVTHNRGSQLEIYSENVEVRIKLTRIR